MKLFKYKRKLKTHYTLIREISLISDYKLQRNKDFLLLSCRQIAFDVKRATKKLYDQLLFCNVHK